MCPSDACSDVYEQSNTNNFSFKAAAADAEAWSEPTLLQFA